MNTKIKLKAIIWPIVYLLLITSVCVSGFLVFHAYYYTPIYVSGSSMEPTLVGQGEMVDYGIIDTHSYAIKNITIKKDRFKIVTTYYPFQNGASGDYEGGYDPEKENIISKDASYKIKRIYAFPGEAFKFAVEEGDIKLYVQNVGLEKVKNPETIIDWTGIKPVNITFNRLFDSVDYSLYDGFEYVLQENEYWVMGDNYNSSYDCFKAKKPIYLDNIMGVLVAIEGRCHINRNSSYDKDGTHISATCTNRQRYSWPKYF